MCMLDFRLVCLWPSMSLEKSESEVNDGKDDDASSSLRLLKLSNIDMYVGLGLVLRCNDVLSTLSTYHRRFHTFSLLVRLKYYLAVRVCIFLIELSQFHVVLVINTSIYPRLERTLMDRHTPGTYQH